MRGGSRYEWVCYCVTRIKPQTIGDRDDLWVLVHSRASRWGRNGSLRPEKKQCQH